MWFQLFISIKPAGISIKSVVKVLQAILGSKDEEEEEKGGGRGEFLSTTLPSFFICYRWKSRMKRGRREIYLKGMSDRKDE